MRVLVVGVVDAETHLIAALVARLVEQGEEDPSPVGEGIEILEQELGPSLGRQREVGIHAITRPLELHDVRFGRGKVEGHDGQVADLRDQPLSPGEFAQESSTRVTSHVIVAARLSSIDGRSVTGTESGYEVGAFRRGLSRSPLHSPAGVDRSEPDSP